MVQRRLLNIFLFLLALMVVVLPLAHAATYSFGVDTIDNEILRNETASYKVTIVNFGDSSGDFQVYTIDPSWGVKTEPFDLSVLPKSEKLFTMYLRPSSTAPFGTQGIVVNFKELNSGAVVRKTVMLNLRNLDTPEKEYVPTVAFDVSMPYEIDPRAPIPLRIELRNRNPLNITNLTIRVFSPHFNANTEVNLGPLSVKTKDIVGLSMPPRTPSGEEDVQVQLLYKDKIVGQLVKNYRIKEYTQIKQDIAESAFFFKTDKTIVITNDGNVQNTAVVTVPTSLIKSLFVSSSLPYDSGTENGQRVLLWSIPLDADGTATFSYTENYRILILLALIAIVSAIAYLLLRSPVVSIKEAVAIAHRDGVSDIKVRLFVKNRSAKLVQAITVTDRVPSLADVLKSDSPGSLSPTKVAVSEKQGTLLRWELEVLEPFEERILTYQVKSKLKIIGRMKLPNAKISFQQSGKERVVYSNNIELVERFKDR